MQIHMQRPKKLILICVILLLSLVFSIPAYSLDFNGSSSGSGGGGTTASSYAVNTNGTSLVGFRFSLVDSNNTDLGNSIDVITHSSTSACRSHNKFNLKKSKAYWVPRYTSLSAINTSTSNTNFYHQSSLGFSTQLPTISSLTDIDNLATNLNSWQKDGDNIDVILSLIGDVEVTNTTKIGTNKIIIEPLLNVGLKGGSNHVLTMTELAIYGGGYEYNGNWNKAPASSSNSGTWGFISKYTNRHFPNYMRTATAVCNWKAAPELSDIASFKTIITCGYGANVLSADSMGLYIVKYDANGGTGAPAAQTKIHGVNLTLSSTKPTRTGYTFTGWNTEADGSGYAKAPGGTMTGNWNVTFYAQWTPITYTVKYDANGGIGAPASQTKTYGVNLTLSSTEPTRIGYTFTGWNTEADGSGYAKAPGGTMTGNWSVTFYAQWKANILFDLNYDDINVNYFIPNNSWSDAVTYSIDPTTGVITFDGANTADFHLGQTEGLDVAEGDTFTMTMTYVGGSYSGSGSFTFDFLGLSTREHMDIFSPPTADNPVQSCTITASANAADASNGFKAWVWKNAGYEFDNYQFTLKIEKSGSKTEQSPNALSIAEGDTYGTLPSPTRAGYNFTGWYTEAVGGENITAESIVSESIILYAHWENGQKSLELIALEPNASYRESTDVITSYWIVNQSSEHCIPTDNITVQFSVFDSNNILITKAARNIIVPANDKNLLYFKWTVPTGLNSTDVFIKAIINDKGNEYGLISKSYSTIPYIRYSTPNTQYEENAPVDFSIPDKPTDTGILQAKWWEYCYDNGAFTKINYGIGTKIYPLGLTAPNSKSASLINGVLTMRSGYGFRAPFEARSLGIEGYTMPSSDSYTVRQYAYALFPEFNYRFGEGLCRTVFDIGGIFNFVNSLDSIIDHFTPLYYPDGEYHLKLVASDSWTPAGMITTSELQTLIISGSLYDDHYIGRK